MTQDKKDDRLKKIVRDDMQEPEVYKVVRHGQDFEVDRRTFLGGVGAGAIALMTGCASPPNRT